MRIEVIDSGIFASIQDLGRPYRRQYGIPQTGVMDTWNTALANRLVGNSMNASVIEFTMKGGKLRFDDHALIALTGADMSAKINDHVIEINKAIEVKDGDILELGYAAKGFRCYLAVQGAWNVEKVFDSTSTYTAAGLGGIDGRPLRSGDFIEIENEAIRKAEPISKEYFRYVGSKLEVRFIAGPEWNQLPKAQQDQFLKSAYSIESNSDRMGVRLRSEESIDYERKPMISSAVVPGVIQLTNAGQPIILMKDAQTVGGYPRLGCVIRIDLSRLAQLQPNSEVRFKLIDKEEALELYRHYSVQLSELFN